MYGYKFDRKPNWRSGKIMLWVDHHTLGLICATMCAISIYWDQVQLDPPPPIFFPPFIPPRTKMKWMLDFLDTQFTKRLPLSHIFDCHPHSLDIGKYQNITRGMRAMLQIKDRYLEIGMAWILNLRMEDIIETVSSGVCGYASTIFRVSGGIVQNSVN